MRILMTTDTVGGVWTYARELVSGLLEADPYARIFLFAVGSNTTPEQLGWLRTMRECNPGRFDAAVHAVPLEWEQSNDQVDPMEPRLMAIAQTFGPDVFHSNQFCYGALPIACPKLVVAHSDVLSWFRSVHGNLPSPSPWLDRYIALVSNGLAHSTAVAAPTRWMLQALREGFAVESRTCVIPNGIKPRERAADGRHLQAVTAGRLWDKGKNIDLLQRVKHLAVPVLVAGALQHQDADFQWHGSPQVRLLGACSRRNLLSLFADSAMYLSTACYEPFGLSALEAAWSGCALLSFDIGSMREVWGGSALYFRTAEELSDLLEHLAASPAELEAAQQRAFMAARRYTRQRMAEGYRALYRDLMNLPRGFSTIA